MISRIEILIHITTINQTQGDAAFAAGNCALRVDDQQMHILLTIGRTPADRRRAIQTPRRSTLRTPIVSSAHTR